MKLSLAWIFEHIEGSQVLDRARVDALVADFNRKTAEIEAVDAWTLDADSFALGVVTGCNESDCIVSIAEWGQDVTLPLRSDLSVGGAALVKRATKSTSWATYADFAIERDGVIAPVHCKAGQEDGSWKKDVIWDDIVIDVDNKSITHRPDMWGHRGFAREIAMLLDLKLKKESDFLTELPVVEHGAKGFYPADDMPFAINNNAPEQCSRFTATYFDQVDHTPSFLPMVFRLLSVDAKPINGLVDLTNYIMLDWGQPVHAYDADTIEDKTIIIRHAIDGKSLSLLDGQDVTLVPEDLVIASGAGPMALAGVMGGSKHSVLPNTTKILFEAATFHPTSVRKAAIRHNARTESSARFEKTLSENLTAQAPQRFVALAAQYGITLSGGSIHAVGVLSKAKAITVDHAFFEQRAGIAFSSDDVEKPLSALGFDVASTDGIYTIGIPHFRASKDVSIKEDILEEIVRCYGLDRIEPKLPKIGGNPISLAPRRRLHAIKKLLAYGADMIEQANYAWIDEPFAGQLGHNPSKTHGLLNPVSENATRMVTTLIPGLLKNIADNYVAFDNLSFFESARTWNPSGDDLGEREMVSGVFFAKRSLVDFYAQKQHIESLLNLCGITEAIWEKTAPDEAFWHPYKTANIIVGGVVIGKAGSLSAGVWSRLGMLTSCDAFAFELNMEFLKTYQASLVKFEPLTKFQEHTFDLSFMVSADVTVAAMETALINSSKTIKSVDLIDLFEKAEWEGKRSLAFSVNFYDTEKMLTKDEIEAVRQAAMDAGAAVGGQIRSE